MNPFVAAQEFSMKGQFWGSIQTSDDIPVGEASLEYTIGYIPTFSLYKDLNENSFVDMEFSVQSQRMYSGDFLTNNIEKFHRYWFRYSTEKLEARLGMQKIIFGPSQVLRSLSWFDTFNLTDPTGQTDGVEAFRIKWFPSNFLSAWSWGIINTQDTLSYGGRLEISTNRGEWGLTYHHDPSSSIQPLGQSNIPIAGPQNRLAIDYRYDGFIGLWNESAIIRANDFELEMIMIGADYTLPIATGILVMMESMLISSKQNISTSSSQRHTAFMASMPLGIFHQIMFLSNINWDQKYNYNYLRWSSTYDQYSINCILSFSPKRREYDISLDTSSQNLANFGTGIQIMFIYNH